ncbi:MAG TPA: hypothetical protein VM621_10130 [Luteibacter sp.]|uniref:hypothetical protein n=1 Tax=Luteibacter sp. TaxID=1886636 RepID=UPI002BF02987|nr:hypothetical protein [Luteibacter sp.]HVI55398.1 hypothetical protein [Luteibacter sp.]
MRGDLSRRSARALPVERWIRIAALSFIAIAAVAAIFCHDNALGRSWARNILQIAYFIPARRWALHASYADEAAIYYFFTWPVLPLATAWVIARFAFPLPAAFSNGRGVLDALRTIIAIPVLAFVGILILLGKSGSDLPFLRIGTHFEQLILFGWLGFAMPGILFGLCGLYCRKAFLDIKGVTRK